MAATLRHMLLRLRTSLSSITTKNVSTSSSLTTLIARPTFVSLFSKSKLVDTSRVGLVSRLTSGHGSLTSQTIQQWTRSFSSSSRIGAKNTKFIHPFDMDKESDVQAQGWQAKASHAAAADKKNKPPSTLPIDTLANKDAEIAKHDLTHVKPLQHPLKQSNHSPESEQVESIAHLPKPRGHRPIKPVYEPRAAKQRGHMEIDADWLELKRSENLRKADEAQLKSSFDIVIKIAQINEKAHHLAIRLGEPVDPNVQKWIEITQGRRWPACDSWQDRYFGTPMDLEKFELKGLVMQPDLRAQFLAEVFVTVRGKRIDPPVMTRQMQRVTKQLKEAAKRLVRLQQLEKYMLAARQHLGRDSKTLS
ncbi:hypothetical protein OIO90_003985 [Microbotryomycetes sp. JL221]|nr:hypothetical protein OIO90_003985 [Microbotryomycetes sp. JL221]